MRLVAVGGLRDRAETPFAEVGFDAVENSFARGLHKPGGVEVGPKQPGPYGALVVGGIAFGRAAAMVGPIARIVGRQRAQPERGEEAPPAYVDDTGRGRVVQRPVRERHREELVRPDRRIVPVGAVDHVEEAGAVRANEAGNERRGGVLAQRGEAVVATGELGGDVEGSQPERVDLDGLAGARSDRARRRSGRPSR